MKSKIVAHYPFLLLTRLFHRPGRIFYQKSQYVMFSSSTDGFVDNFILEEQCKRENTLLKYFEDKCPKILLPVRLSSETGVKHTSRDEFYETHIQELVKYIESYTKEEDGVPNSQLNCMLVYFAKNGNTSGIKAIQVIVKENNILHFRQQSEYKHYLAEALFINGNIGDALKLFAIAYDNKQIQSQVKAMLKSLFPLLISQHGSGTLYKSIHTIEKFSIEKEDYVILSCLWKELFQSAWFSDHQLAKKILINNNKLLHVVHWMIPSIGKDFLKNNRVDDFYRLIEFTLVNNLNKYEDILIRLLFEYYYIHQNIERCSAVVKYSSRNNSGTPLTEDQQRRYIDLLLRSKNSVSSKLNMKKSKNIKYIF